MNYCKFSLDRELKKAAIGKKTKLPVGLVLYLALDHYPKVQKRIAKAFSISSER